MESEPQPPLTLVQSIAIHVAMLLALVLIGFGLWALGGAIFAAWSLFRDPQGIGYFANYFLTSAKLGAELQIDGQGLAHYVAWVAVVLLLLILGKLGAWAVGAGARLISLRPGRRD
jgi:hypothetical protein